MKKKVMNSIPRFNNKKLKNIKLDKIYSNAQTGFFTIKLKLVTPIIIIGKKILI